MNANSFQKCQHSENIHGSKENIIYSNDKDNSCNSCELNDIYINTREKCCVFKLTPVTDERIECLKELTNLVSMFNTEVKGLKAFIELCYHLPYELQEKFETEAEEVGNLYRELQAAVRNSQIIISQREAMAKEKLSTDGQLLKLKSDVINELEMIVSVYDPMMMTRWEAVKCCDDSVDIENLLIDVKGKFEAMKNLQALCSQKLLELDEKKEQNNSETDKKDKTKDATSTQNSDHNFSVSNISNLSQTSSQTTYSNPDDAWDEGVPYSL